MLVPIRTSGTRPALFFVHGAHGVMPLRPSLAPVLGTDQPFYIIHANGMDGRDPVIDNMQEMVHAYVHQIQTARPIGPLRIAGMCAGTLAAIEIVRELQRRGRETGPVILADPPLVFGSHKQVDPRQPKVAQQLYRDVRRALVALASLPYFEVPFDPAEPDQVHHSTLSAIGSLTALSNHIPRPFSDLAELIVSAQRAPAFFHSEMHWTKLLPGPRTVHILPWRHEELFRSGRHHVARMIQFMLQEPPVRSVAQRQKASISA